MNQKINRQRNYHRNGDIVYNQEQVKARGTNIVYQSVSEPDFTLDEVSGNLLYDSSTEVQQSQTRNTLTVSFDPWLYVSIYPEEINIVADVPNILISADLFVLDQSTGNLIINA